MFVRKIVSALLGATALAAVALPSFAGGSKTDAWGQIGGWQIRVDTSVGNGCFAFMQFQRGSIMRIGFAPQNRQIYFLFGHEDMTDMEAGKSYTVRFQFEDGTYFDGPAKTIDMDGHTFFYIIAHADFMAQFAKRDNLKIIHRGKIMFNVSLENSYAALQEVLRCQRAQNGNPTPDNNAPRTPQKRDWSV